jgi:hypothetical protein
MPRTSRPRPSRPLWRPRRATTSSPRPRRQPPTDGRTSPAPAPVAQDQAPAFSHPKAEPTAKAVPATLRPEPSHPVAELDQFEAQLAGSSRPMAETVTASRPTAETGRLRGRHVEFSRPMAEPVVRRPEASPASAPLGSRPTSGRCALTTRRRQHRVARPCSGPRACH